MRYARRLVAPELSVLEINVMHNFGDGAQRGIVQCAPFEQNLK